MGGTILVQYDFTLTWLCLQRPSFQVWLHSQVPEVRTWHSFWRDTINLIIAGWGWMSMMSHSHSGCWGWLSDRNSARLLTKAPEHGGLGEAELLTWWLIPLLPPPPSADILRTGRKLHGLFWPCLRNHIASLVSYSIGWSSHRLWLPVEECERIWEYGIICSLKWNVQCFYKWKGINKTVKSLQKPMTVLLPTPHW